MPIETVIYLTRKGVESRGYRFVVPDDTPADRDAINSVATADLDHLKIEYDSINILGVDSVIEQLKALKNEDDQ